MNIDELEKRIKEHGQHARRNERAYSYVMQKINEGTDTEIYNDIREILKRDMIQLVFRLEYIGREASQLYNEQDQTRIVTALKEAQKEYNQARYD